jgi:Tfp pilus assembly protein PilX
MNDLNSMNMNTHERGIALLVTLLVMTVLMGVSASLLNITLKQYQFSGIGLQSEMAFQAANAGMECIQYHDYQGYPTSKFDVAGNGSAVPPETGVGCMGQSSNDLVNGSNSVTSGEEQRFQFTWRDTSVSGTPTVCTDVSIYKFYNTASAQDMTTALGRSATCAAGVTCTIIRSRGYNVACGSINTPRTIERELTQRY